MIDYVADVVKLPRELENLKLANLKLSNELALEASPIVRPNWDAIKRTPANVKLKHAVDSELEPELRLLAVNPIAALLLLILALFKVKWVHGATMRRTGRISL